MFEIFPNFTFQDFNGLIFGGIIFLIVEIIFFYALKKFFDRNFPP
jgi:hypothetical protein